MIDDTSCFTDHNALINETIQLLLSDLFNPKARDLSLSSQGKTICKEIKHMIKTRMLDDPCVKMSLKSIALLYGISQFQLIRSFKSHFGITPHAYQVCLRLEQAKSMLMKKSAIFEVALKTGFSDQSHFTRCFKRAYFTTPAQFQRQLQ